MMKKPIKLNRNWKIISSNYDLINQRIYYV